MNQAVDRSPAVEVDEREDAIEERIAHVDDVDVREMDDRVSIGVGVLHVEGANLLAVPMERHRIGEGDHGERVRRRLLRPFHHLVELLGIQAFAHILVGYDHRAGLAEVLVTASVIAVPVGVQHEAHRAVADGGYRRHDLLGKAGELVVYHERPVLAHRQADVASRPHQHVHAVGNRDGTNLHAREIPLRGQRCGYQAGSQHSE